MQKTNIPWTEFSWNPSIGCENTCSYCYARKVHNMRHKAYMAGKKLPVQYAKPFEEIQLFPDRLEDPLRRKKPAKIFVGSVADLFSPSVPFEFIDKVMAVIALCPQHTFQCLSKRPEIMQNYFDSIDTPFRITKALDAIKVNNKANKTKEKIKPIKGFEGYFISNKGCVYSAKGSGSCVNCGKEIGGFAKSKYCSKKCLNHARYIKNKTGTYPLPSTLCKMSPCIGKQGHQRIMLYKNTASYRFLVHRLVLEHFDRPPKKNEQCCHVDSNPLNNHICNLRWGSQSDNWADSKRHGTFNRHKTQNNNIKPQIQWPLPNLHLGVTAENQEMADKRIPILLQIPAAVRFVSVEPMLGVVDMKPNYCDYLEGWTTESEAVPDGRGDFDQQAVQVQTHKLDWVIIGAESGPGARHCPTANIRSVVNQCKDAGVACFVKQIHMWKANWDNRVYETAEEARLHIGCANPKRVLIKDIDQFSAGLQIREYPER